MNIELQYKKALEANKLKESQLPEDAQIGISVITDSLKAVNMLEKKGRKISDKAIKKIKAMDKWVYYEILDMVHDTDNNDSKDMPYDEEEIIDDLKDDSEIVDKPITNTNQSDAQGIEIELKSLYDNGKKQLSLNDLKNSAKKVYNLIFDTYESGEENGVETSHYTLIETDKEIFTLNKK
jgi:hypothetical protein